jgi:hypothetical protein
MRFSVLLTRRPYQAAVVPAWRRTFMGAARRVVVTLLLPVFVGTPALAEPAATLSVDAIAQKYGALRSASMLEISPNGELIAFRKVQEDGDLVIVYSLAKGKMVAGANVDELNPQDLYFINDDYLVMVASERRRLMGYRGELNLSTAFALNVQSGEMEQLLLPGR